MENFTPYSALLGGALIGLSAVMLMALLGRVAGISGILASAAEQKGEERGWRLAFLAGLVIAPALYWALSGAKPAFELQAGPVLIVLAGLLVGFGARLGSGCTSGHGVCGLSRLSPRSLAAAAVFMGVAIATKAMVGLMITA